MNELEKTENLEPETTDEASIILGQLMGRREAFGLIAGRCSAAEVENLRKIRDSKAYLKAKCDWEQFCTRYLHAVRRTVDREIAYLERYGPGFFTVRQMTRISVKEYQAIAEHVTEQGVSLDGALIPFGADQNDQLSAAVDQLLQRAETKPREPGAAPFSSILKRCRSLADQLRTWNGSLDAAGRLELGAAVAGIRAAAAQLGVTIWDRR